jgi:glycosyltransferase involved in cell wall biosynthesis
LIQSEKNTEKIINELSFHDRENEASLINPLDFMKQKLVSVIIPTYNRAHSVVDAIQSVKNQSYAAVQIIIVDDGSQDNTAKVIAQFQDVEYYYQENKGQGAARNLGLQYAKGEYVASLDSDDIWQPDFLAQSVKCLEKHDLDFVFLNWKSSNGKESFLDLWDRQEKWQKYITEKDDDWLMIDASRLRRLFLSICPAPTSSFLLRRSSVNLWNEEVIAADDWFLILDMVVSKPCRAGFNLSHYWLKRVFNDNIYDGREIMEVTENLLHDDQLMSRYLYSNLTFPEKYIFRKRLACNHFNFGRLKWKRENNSKIAVKNIAKAFSLEPFGVCFYILEVFVNSFKYRMQTLLPEKPRNEDQTVKVEIEKKSALK